MRKPKPPPPPSCDLPACGPPARYTPVRRARPTGRTIHWSRDPPAREEDARQPRNTCASPFMAICSRLRSLPRAVHLPSSDDQFCYRNRQTAQRLRHLRHRGSPNRFSSTTAREGRPNRDSSRSPPPAVQPSGSRPHQRPTTAQRLRSRRQSESALRAPSPTGL
ncbi:hypothetical protein MANES_17G036805v8 [Manihot esculenta]|uniref:Uncharacterized protein n=1 Tax=Manihot esculenta TaxID=3983 RepID=A0ACB7G3C6_MANES|nr:hypothetical protein MANES_17G036805v8 [Manihot esculenta]